MGTHRPRNLRSQNRPIPARSVKTINSARLTASVLHRPFTLNAQSVQ